MIDFNVTTMERRFSVSAILGLPLLGVSACSSDRSDTQEGSEPEVIEYVVWIEGYKDQEEDYFRSVLPPVVRHNDLPRERRFDEVRLVEIEGDIEYNIEDNEDRIGGYRSSTGGEGEADDFYATLFRVPRSIYEGDRFYTYVHPQVPIQESVTKLETTLSFVDEADFQDWNVGDPIEYKEKVTFYLITPYITEVISSQETTEFDVYISESMRDPFNDVRVMLRLDDAPDFISIPEGVDRSGKYLTLSINQSEPIPEGEYNFELVYLSGLEEVKARDINIYVDVA